MKTELNSRTLWYDGTSEVAPELVPELLLSGVPIEQLVVSGPSEDVARYNQLSTEELPASKVKNEPLDIGFNIPLEYLKLDFEAHARAKLEKFLQDNQVDAAPYVQRLEAELREINLRGMVVLFRTLVYVVETFRKEGTVWGVGRGSSCASLVLFLIGLHQVDCVRYQIPLEEFFH